MEGDRKYNIQTFATQLGVRNISLLVGLRASSHSHRQRADRLCVVAQAIGMLLSSYAAAILLALRLPGVFNVPIMAGGHAVLALGLVLKVRHGSKCSTPSQF